MQIESLNRVAIAFIKITAHTFYMSEPFLSETIEVKIIYYEKKKNGIVFEIEYD